VRLHNRLRPKTSNFLKERKGTVIQGCCDRHLEDFHISLFEKRERKRQRDTRTVFLNIFQVEEPLELLEQPKGRVLYHSILGKN